MFYKLYFILLFIIINTINISGAKCKEYIIVMEQDSCSGHVKPKTLNETDWHLSNCPDDRTYTLSYDEIYRNKSCVIELSYSSKTDIENTCERIEPEVKEEIDKINLVYVNDNITISSLDVDNYNESKDFSHVLKCNYSENICEDTYYGDTDSYNVTANSIVAFIGKGNSVITGDNNYSKNVTDFNCTIISNNTKVLNDYITLSYNIVKDYKCKKNFTKDNSTIVSHSVNIYFQKEFMYYNTTKDIKCSNVFQAIGNDTLSIECNFYEENSTDIAPTSVQNDEVNIIYVNKNTSSLELVNKNSDNVKFVMQCDYIESTCLDKERVKHDHVTATANTILAIIGQDDNTNFTQENITTKNITGFNCTSIANNTNIDEIYIKLTYDVIRKHSCWKNTTNNSTLSVNLYFENVLMPARNDNIYYLGNFVPINNDTMSIDCNFVTPEKNTTDITPALIPDLDYNTSSIFNCEYENEKDYFKTNEVLSFGDCLKVINYVSKTFTYETDNIVMLLKRNEVNVDKDKDKIIHSDKSRPTTKTIPDSRSEYIKVHLILNNRSKCNESALNITRGRIINISTEDDNNSTFYELNVKNCLNNYKVNESTTNNSVELDIIISNQNNSDLNDTLINNLIDESTGIKNNDTRKAILNCLHSHKKAINISRHNNDKKLTLECEFLDLELYKEVDRDIVNVTTKTDTPIINHTLEKYSRQLNDTEENSSDINNDTKSTDLPNITIPPVYNRKEIAKVRTTEAPDSWNSESSSYYGEKKQREKDKEPLFADNVLVIATAVLSVLGATSAVAIYALKIFRPPIYRYHPTATRDLDDWRFS
ncbi:uncharacterized protein LOC142973845 [Anticarsia gemmatalis]|uniref:uncharacterized protein LOC142973845 n=1 Tax=Anticarsia gemmatalis TaxID=129554 RepID=UPI003F774C3A